MRSHLFLAQLFLAFLALALVACGGSGGGRNQAPAPNQAPQLGPLDDESVDANASVSKTIAVSDDQTAADALQVRVASDDTELVPAEGLSVSERGATRTLEITPRTDSIGTATLTVEVADDAGLASSASFDVNVLALPREASTFSRDLAGADAFDEPAPINAIEFNDDAQDDAFDDLLSNE